MNIEANGGQSVDYQQPVADAFRPDQRNGCGQVFIDRSEDSNLFHGVEDGAQRVVCGKNEHISSANLVKNGEKITPHLCC